eukprot:Em0020g593a
MPLALPLMLKRSPSGSAAVASIQWLKESLEQLKLCLKDALLSHSTGATTQMRTAWSPLCCEILDQPLELMYSAIVCAKCLNAWLVVSVDVQCPCCFNREPLASSYIKTTPTLVLNLLSDVVVHCVLCSRDQKASGYKGHTYEFPPTRAEMRSVALILSQVLAQGAHTQDACLGLSISVLTVPIFAPPVLEFHPECYSWGCIKSEFVGIVILSHPAN